MHIFPHMHFHKFDAIVKIIQIIDFIRDKLRQFTYSFQSRNSEIYPFFSAKTTGNENPIRSILICDSCNLIITQNYPMTEQKYEQLECNRQLMIAIDRLLFGFMRGNYWRVDNLC